jgi:signal transduction histidine kinase
VHALLELARAQTGGQVPAAERVLIKPLLEDVARGLRPASSVRVEVVCPARLAALANRSLAEQAVLNIAGNAAKYTLEGSILLVGRRIDAECIAIEVTDTGPGVADDERPRVFERFYRGVTRDRTGFGLGLAIAEQAARVLGGQIALESRPEGGTTVRLTLPAATRS